MSETKSDAERLSMELLAWAAPSDLLVGVEDALDDGASWVFDPDIDGQTLLRYKSRTIVICRLEAEDFEAAESFTEGVGL